METLESHPEGAEGVDTPAEEDIQHNVNDVELNWKHMETLESHPGIPGGAEGVSTPAVEDKYYVRPESVSVKDDIQREGEGEAQNLINQAHEDLGVEISVENDKIQGHEEVGGTSPANTDTQTDDDLVEDEIQYDIREDNTVAQKMLEDISVRFEPYDLAIECKAENLTKSNCIHCKTNMKPIHSFNEIELIGKHICKPGAFGNRGKGKKPLYRHHGIVSDVEILSDEKARITTIHLGKVKNTDKRKKGCKIIVHESIKEYDLTRDQIHVFNYDFPYYEPEYIVERARNSIGKGNYCLCTNNCEHFANWCVLGDRGESYETAGMGRCCVDAWSQIGGCSYVIKLGVKFTLKTLFSRLADISDIIIYDNAIRKRNTLVWLEKYLAWIICGIIAFILFIRVFFVQRNFWRRRYKKHMLCNDCFKYKSVRLWVEYVSFLLISLIGTLCINYVEYYCPFNLEIQVIILMTLVSGILIWFIPKLIINLCFPKERTTFCAKTLTKIVLIITAVAIFGLIIGISVTVYFDEACSMSSNEILPVRNVTSAP